MAPNTSPVRRLLFAGGFAVAVAAAPAAAFFAVPAAGISPVAACPSGETEDLFTDACVPHLSPNVSGGISYSTPGDAYSVPEVQGIPCTGRNTGECIGLEEDQVQQVVPRSTISSSP